MKYEREAGARKIDVHADWLRQALEADSYRPRSGRHTGLKLQQQIRAQGYVGSYGRVTDFIRGWTRQDGAVAARAAYVPLSFDWSEEHLLVGEIGRKIQLAHMKLGAARAFWLVAYPGQSHKMLFDFQRAAITTSKLVRAFHSGSW